MKKKTVSLLLAFAVILPCITVAANASEPEFILNGMEPEYYIMLNSADSNSDVFLLGSLSAKYESNGDPSAISAGNDTGGVSYGAYQFSSYYGVPLEFANWCVSSGEGLESGQRLLDAYAADGNTYGTQFNAVWRSIAAEDSTAFLVLQHNFTKSRYYDVMVAKLEAQVYGFKVDDYTIALKNVIWSRAVQQGANSDVITKAFENLGGFKYQAEDILIKAIYAQSSLLVDTPPYSTSIAITESSAVKYGVDSATVTGKYLYYYSRNSSDIQVAVYKRLAVSELSDALAMYEEYKSDNPLIPSQPGTTTPTQPGTTAPSETTTSSGSSGGLIPIPPTTTNPSDSEETTTQPTTQPDSTTGGSTLLDNVGDFFRSILSGIAAFIDMIIRLLESFA